MLFGIAKTILDFVPTPFFPNQLSLNSELDAHILRTLKASAAGSAIQTRNLLDVIQAGVKATEPGASREDAAINETLRIAEFDIVALRSMLPTQWSLAKGLPILEDINPLKVTTFSYVLGEKWSDFEAARAALNVQPNDEVGWIGWQRAVTAALNALHPNARQEITVGGPWLPSTVDELIAGHTRSTGPLFLSRFERELGFILPVLTTASQITVGDRLIGTHQIADLEQDWPVDPRINLRYLVGGALPTHTTDRFLPTRELSPAEVAKSLNERIWDAATIHCPPGQHRDKVTATYEAAHAIAPPSLRLVVPPTELDLPTL